MSDDEKMGLDERYKYLRKRQKPYRKASREEKSRLLDEMEEVTGLHRKSLVRLMGGEIRRKARKRERGCTYGADVAAAIGLVAESLDWVCAERLQPSLVWMAEHLASHGELSPTPEVLEKLGTVSISTVRRILSVQPQDRPRLPRKGPRQANRLRCEIPAERIAWQEQEPGHFEVDLVHHCGPSASGNFVHTLQMVDVATGWSERVATLGRGYAAMEDAFRRILARLPFAVREIHPDNGSEFLNNHLVRFWKKKVKDLRLSRSRAWFKNDNRFVEQKNDTLVRAYLGYDRLDTVQQTNLLNQLYDRMWLYYNFFQPVMRLEEKVIEPIPGKRGYKVKRRFDTAQTPLERLCEVGGLSPDRQAELQTLRDTTNPRQLRRDIYALLDQLFALPCANPEQGTQNVYLTFFLPPDFMKGADSSVTFSNERTVPVR
jgi:hypothetical protein